MKRLSALPPPEARNRLWPCFSGLRQELLSNHGKSLPEPIREVLLGMEDETSEQDDTTERKMNRNGFDHGNPANIGKIGTMARTTNAWFESQMKAHTSEAVYTPATLDAYDALVWDFNSPFHWRIHRSEINALYQSCLENSRRHCEVAVGTGLFLRDWAQAVTQDTSDGQQQQKPQPLLERLTLMDLSPSSLEGCHQRLLGEDFFQTSLSSIDTVRADICHEPPAEYQRTFDSVAANFLLHCLHGKSLRDKASAVRSCASLLRRESGVCFGSTILGRDLWEDRETAGKPSVDTMHHYNDLGIFGNAGDTFDDLVTVLEDAFDSVSVSKVGYCAVWVAKHPKA